ARPAADPDRDRHRERLVARASRPGTAAVARTSRSVRLRTSRELPVRKRDPDRLGLRIRGCRPLLSGLDLHSVRRVTPEPGWPSPSPDSHWQVPMPKTQISRFQIHDELTAPEGSLPVLKGASSSAGQLPNFLGVLAGSPAALRGYTRFRGEM